MRKLIVLIGLVVAGIAASPATAAIEAQITKPEAGARSLSGVVGVEVTASATSGIYAVQLNVDGKPYGDLVTTPTAPYSYVLPWDTKALAFGSHTLSVTAIDWSQPFPGGATLTSDPITVDVGPAYPTIALTAPPAWTFVRGTTQIQADVSTALGPTGVQFTLDGSPLASSSAPPWTASWNTATGPDGQHVIGATVTDGRGKAASAATTVTVDNSPAIVYFLSPAQNAFTTGSLPVQAHASDAYGVASLQLAIDGVAVGAPLTQPDAGVPYTYSATLPLAGIAAGPHKLSVVATDLAGNKATSIVDFTIGVPAPTLTITAPPDWTLVRGIVPVTAAVVGGTPPMTARLVVDGVATTQTASVVPFVFQWDTTKLADGTHTVAVSVADAQGRTATSPVLNETIDNTKPSGYTTSPTANQRVSGPFRLGAHASDGYGVKSVEFLVDGAAAGAAVTSPEAGKPYDFSTIFDTTALTPGTHSVTAVITDNAGNQTTLAAVSIKTGPIEYLPVLNYHEINAPDGNSPWDQTPEQADQELGWLKANGYQSVTLDQYRQWLAGQNIGIAKPVLITVDDGLRSEQAWDPLLAKYGFKAVMFVVTGLADNRTPGSIDDPNNMSWTEIRALAASGRWQIAFHAGQYGHGDSYDEGAKIGSLSYQASCPYFYSCLAGTTSRGTWRAQSVSSFKTAVTNEVNAGIARLRQQVPSTSLLAWAVPFNDAGQWTNLYNDPSGQVQAWLPGFMASKFPIVFTQTNPVTYGQASGTVGSLTGFNRRYRFEVRTDTTIEQFAAALQDPAFAR